MVRAARSKIRAVSFTWLTICDTCGFDSGIMADAPTFSWTGSAPSAQQIVQRVYQPWTNYLNSMNPWGVGNPNLANNSLNQDVAANPYAYFGGGQTHPTVGGQKVADAQQRAMNLAAHQTAADDRVAQSNLPNPSPTTVMPTVVSGSNVTATGEVVNPNINSPAARMATNWMGQGGSEATMHRAQVASGRRPAIDARTSYSPMNFGSPASNEIQAGWGWPAAPMGSAGSALWGQMTQNFNNRVASSRNALQKSIGGPGVDSSTPSGDISGTSDSTDQYV